MKAAVSATLLLAVVGSFAHASSASPIGKVIQLMSDLQSKIITEGQAAHKVYSEAAEFCEDRSRALGFDIKTSTSQAEELKAAIAKETAMIGSLNDKIEELSASLATDEADLKAATTLRAKEAADFMVEEKELTEIIDMLGRATGILEREMQKGGASMLQLKDAQSVTQALTIMVQASALSSIDGAKLAAFVQAAQHTEDEAADEALGAPAAAVYEGHSGDIVTTLQGLTEKAEAQLAEARKKETSALHNFEMLKQSLEDGMKFATKDMDAAKAGLAASSESKATAEGDLGVTTKDLAADTKSLADLHQDCMTKAQDYEAATKSRGEEVKAITEAKAVIVKETGGAEKISYGLNQVSFAQLGRTELASGTDLAKFEAVRLIRDLARRQHSPELAQLASRAAATMQSRGQDGEDPFAKVKLLITDMISKLEEAAGADATQKAYCDKELSETHAKKTERDTAIGKLSTKIDKMSSRAAQLKEEVASLQAALSKLASSQATMDQLRSEEHEDYAKSKADMEQGLAGVKLALKVLREYYGGAGTAHAAASGAGSGIIGLLEVVESDLSQGLAGIVATEESSKAAYEAETKENEIEKTSKEQDTKYKAQEAAGLDKAVAEATSDRSSEQAELDAVMEYLASLNKQCTSKAETYEERKARREAEIEGLKQALTILEGEAMLLQRQTARRALRGPQARLATE